MIMENRWYAKKIPEILEIFNSSEHGLTKKEASRRLQEYGPNKLPEAKVDSQLVIFLRQFQSSLIYILLAASVIVFAMGEIIDGSIILVILFFNAIVGTIQEGKAQNTLLALKKFAETISTVLREGKEIIIRDSEVAPGDIIILQEGEKISADARIIFSNNFKVDEAALTGESEPVHKIAETLDNLELPATEQKNMVFKGTHIVAGNAKAIVVATGLKTIIGKISKEIAVIETEIPLKTNIRYLSRLIIITVAIISAILFSLGLIYGKSIQEMFTIIVALSISIIPEGLPIVITLVLTTGVWRMAKHNALIKRLQAVEALGQTRVIAVDKTGTITKNELVIQKVYVDDKFFEIGGIGYEPKADIKLAGKIIDPLNHPELLLVGKITAFCSNARVMFLNETQQWRVAGDPTDAAMLVLAKKIGFNKDDLESEALKIIEIPFDYRTKYHVTGQKIDDKILLTVTGAPEVLLHLSKKIWRNKENFPFTRVTQEKKQELESIFIKMSQQGMRVVGLAIKDDIKEPLTSESVRDLVFVGFLGIKDSPRLEVKQVIKKINSLDIRVVMITGDHKITAQVIAKEAGIYQDGDTILTGQEIDTLSDAELMEKLAKTTVFARVTPEHKLRIIKSYRARGEIIAMTGDGVNDVPSLVAADLGVAMGKIGADVAKEASDIVLLDDNLGNIILAIEEGRNIYKTIKKVILYLFSTSVGEVFTILVALFLAYPLPLLPVQIIWLNFVTDGFLDVALAMEPKEKGLLRRDFERSKKYLVDKLMAQRIFLMAAAMMIGTLYLFGSYFKTDLTKALTISLTTLAAFQWLNAWNCRSENKSIFQINPFSNKFLVAATILVIFLQLVLVYHPIMQKLFRTAPLELSEWIIIIAVASSIVFIEELRKLFYRRKLSLFSRKI